MKDIKIGDIVQFNTTCIWDGCSGCVVPQTVKGSQYVSVMLPDNKTIMAFSPYELIKYEG